jgi:uncharacterized protein
LNKIIDMGELLRRTGAERPLRRDQLFKPSLIWSVLRDPFGLWCEYHAPSDLKVPRPRYEQIRMEAGRAHEEEWVRRNYPEAVRIEGFDREAVRATLEAMLRGAPAIHHPQLWDLDGDAYGQGDLILKKDGDSNLGPWHYEALEIKRSSHLREDHQLQCAFYSRVLTKIQGRASDRCCVVLGQGQEVFDPREHEASLDAVIARWRGIRAAEVPPEIGALDDVSSEWRPYAKRLLEERRDVTLIAGFTPRVRAILKDRRGIATIEDLRPLTEVDFQELLGELSGRKYWLQARAYIENCFIAALSEPIQIPKRSRAIFWDVEDSDALCPQGEPPHVYLIGTVEDGQYRSFSCRGAAGEPQMIQEFLEYIGADLGGVVLYQWTGYELGALQAMAERHPRFGERLQAVASRTFDLYAAIKNRVFMPVESYSIKDVAPACGFNWRGDIADGRAAMSRYWSSLNGGAGDALQSVVDYNEDDVRAMVAVVDCLVREGLVQFGGVR